MFWGQDLFPSQMHDAVIGVELSQRVHRPLIFKVDIIEKGGAIVRQTYPIKRAIFLKLIFILGITPPIKTISVVLKRDELAYFVTSKGQYLITDKETADDLKKYIGSFIEEH